MFCLCRTLINNLLTVSFLLGLANIPVLYRSTGFSNSQIKAWQNLLDPKPLSPLHPVTWAPGLLPLSSESRCTYLKFWELSSVSLLSERRKLHWEGWLRAGNRWPSEGRCHPLQRPTLWLGYHVGSEASSGHPSIFPLDRAAETEKTICAFASGVLGSALFLLSTLISICLPFFSF